ncbi:Protein of unknown function (DUF2997) [Seminavis robusta]|uniref:Uncharacterized protein n=1 Tax=Seminavis robusta TaxID=568900 RepID=A0A9N8DZD5_9STRA|nr:Protein of unknown function (DUF2997) [Seminavis robusta]|eukprot:Sro493_g154080.1 Protein of unknown function (DUF2997) (131) ;mRNA; r:29607-29999
MSTQQPLLLILALVIATTMAFLPTTPLYHHARVSALQESWDGNNNNSNKNGVGAIEQIQFKIYPDGRVEETVRGVKGGNCQKVTEKINEQLGKVVDSAPTEEMFEQEVEIDQTLTNTDGGSGSWEGSSSW